MWWPDRIYFDLKLDSKRVLRVATKYIFSDGSDGNETKFLIHFLPELTPHYYLEFVMNNNIEIECPIEWLKERLNFHNLDYDYKTDSLRKGTVVFEESLIISLLRLDARELEVEDLRSYIQDALKVYRHGQAISTLRQLSTKISFVQTIENEIEAWVTALTGQNSPLDIAVMKHFIWQVKRKLGGLSVENHIMPIIYGKSGIGKSYAVSKLIEPLIDVALQTDMSIFSDQFSKRAFSRNYLVFFDELNGSDNADINAMKQIITAPV